MTTIRETERFKRDLKKIIKKQPAFENYYHNYVLIALSKLDVVGTMHAAVQISHLGEKYENYPIYKLRIHRCAGIRIIYHYDKSENTVTMIESYCKNQQENENRELILSYLDEIIRNNAV